MNSSEEELEEKGDAGDSVDIESGMEQESTDRANGQLEETGSADDDVEREDKDAPININTLNRNQIRESEMDDDGGEVVAGGTLAPPPLIFHRSSIQQESAQPPTITEGAIYPSQFATKSQESTHSNRDQTVNSSSDATRSSHISSLSSSSSKLHAYFRGNDASDSDSSDSQGSEGENGEGQEGENNQQNDWVGYNSLRPPGMGRALTAADLPSMPSRGNSRQTSTGSESSSVPGAVRVRGPRHPLAVRPPGTSASCFGPANPQPRGSGRRSTCSNRASLVDNLEEPSQVLTEPIDVGSGHLMEVSAIMVTEGDDDNISSVFFVDEEGHVEYRSNSNLNLGLEGHGSSLAFDPERHPGPTEEEETENNDDDDNSDIAGFSDSPLVGVLVGFTSSFFHLPKAVVEPAAGASRGCCRWMCCVGPTAVVDEEAAPESNHKTCYPFVALGTSALVLCIVGLLLWHFLAV